MAFALPIFLLFIWGIFTIGMIYSHQLALNTAAREACRMGVVGHTMADLQANIKRYTPQLDQTRLTQVITFGNNQCQVGLTYTEHIVGVWPLTMLFKDKVISARCSHQFESPWVPQ